MNSRELEKPINVNDEKVDRLCSWVSGRRQPPLKAVIFPTQFCNLRCIACGVGDAVRSGRFDFDTELGEADWEKIIDMLLSFGVIEWDLAGAGEPMSRSERSCSIVEMVKSRDPGVRVDMTTNGSWFEPRILERLVRAGLDKLQVSIDSPDAAVHDFLRRGKGVFESASATIVEINRLKKKLGRKKPEIFINTVLSAKNYDRLDDFVKFDLDAGVDLHILSPMRITGKTRPRIEKAGMRMTARQIERLYENFKKAERAAKRGGLELKMHVLKDQEEILDEDEVHRYTTALVEYNPRNPLLSAYCYEPWYSFCIDPWGNVGSCQVAAGHCSPQRNLLNRHIEKIWYSDYFEKIRTQIAGHKPLPVCAHCTIGHVRMDLRSKVMAKIGRPAALVPSRGKKGPAKRRQR